MDKQIKIKKMVTAGTVESNDILIMLSEGEGSIDIDLESVVEKQYGEKIRQLIYKTLEDEGVRSAKVIAKDRGALDFTIIARVKAAINRGSGEKDEL